MLKYEHLQLNGNCGENYGKFMEKIVEKIMELNFS